MTGRAFANPPAAPLEFKMVSDPAQIAPVRHAVEQFAVRCGCDEKSVSEIGLAFNEAVANVIRHAYHGAGDRPIHVRVSCAGGQIQITVRDWGSGVNPMAQAPRPRDPLRPGGLGLVCLRSFLDELVYHPQADGMLLEMKRNVRREKLSTPHA